MNASPICFALDYPHVDEARAAAIRVRDSIGMIKVGLELFVEAGPQALALGKECELPVFLDLKLHDIPETVERAVARACALGAKILTIHAGGGPAMCARAAARAAKEATGLTVAAVTVLTSLDAEDLTNMGIADDVATHARRLARMAWIEGIRAFVCSPHEVRAMRAELGAEATLITPGVRSSEQRRAGANAGRRDDQKRVATAADAIEDGADWLVVGRPIRDAADPRAAARALTEEAVRARGVK
jgi:orotidine-5'-phosphate decarboxylase